MNRQVRLGEHQHAGHTAGAGKAMPLRVTNRVQLEFPHDAREQVLQCGNVGETRGITAVRLDDPFLASSWAHVRWRY